MTSVECFGLTFKSKHALSADDRRFLRANGQVISLLEDCRREMREEAETAAAVSGRLQRGRMAGGAIWVNASTRENVTAFHRHLRLAPALLFSLSR